MEKRSKIKNLNKGYFQKSTFFLYPLLKISKKLLPISTYISWSNHSDESKCTLICRYKKFVSPVDIQLEKDQLLDHPRFTSYYELEDGSCVYLFTFDDKYEKVWELFKQGSYSQFPAMIKRDILAFYRTGTSTYDYINSYLYPTEHYSEYAELLNVPVNILKETKELVDIPHIVKETLTIEPKKIDLSSLNLNQNA